MGQVRVLLTGERGFLGSVLQQRLTEEGFDVETCAGDLADVALLREHLAGCPPVDQVIHLAGKFFGTWPELTRANVMTTAAVLEACDEHGVRRIVHASSFAVYGAPGGQASTEAASLAPTTLYGLTKAQAESCVDFFVRNRGWSACVLRLPSLFGPSAQKGVVHDMLQAARAQRRIVIHGDGNQFRQFVHVDDAAQAVLLAVRSQATGPFNVTSPLELTVNQVAAAVRAVVGEDVRTEHVPATNGQPGVRMDGSRARDELGYVSTRTTLDLEAFR